MKKEAKQMTKETMHRTTDAMFNQKMKQHRANMDVKAKLAQKPINTGSPFKRSR